MHKIGSWDLIVVGAGSAGAVVAARSAERGRRVLLVEAGPNDRSADLPEVLRSPGARCLFHLDDWVHWTWPDVLATRTEAQAARLYSRGRGVGGSSAINGQIAIRPPREDFDDWAAAGCQGWSWEEVEPYFCRLETDLDFGYEHYHGDSGPIPVWRMKREDWGAVDEALARAALAAGFDWTDDVNAPGATGVSRYPINSRALRRVSTNDAYLEPARARQNLSILGNALVDRVLMRGGRAIGVEIVSDGRRRVEHGDEIVLCAGAIHSPGILMRSGIGPERLLAELDIEVVSDLPVGEGLQDHPMVVVALPLTSDSVVKTLDDRWTNCCVRYDSGDPDGLPNDLMLVPQNHFDASGAVWPHKRIDDLVDADTMAGAGSIGVWLNSAYSRGTVRIASRDPHMQPVVHERMLSDERDLRRLRDGSRRLTELVASDAIAEICSASLRQANPGLWEALEDDRALDDYLLTTIVDTMHATSTCQMGPANSTASVVGTDLRVLGVQGLSVADASIFPSVPRANTNLATIAVGELVADLLA